MTKRIISILIFVALLTAFAAGIAHSASFTYSSHRKEIKAGALIFPIGGGYVLRPKAPYVFHVLNQRMDIKPQGWEFINPLAPSRVTQDIVTRWGAAGGAAYSVGEAVSKDMGCYWEVKIDAGLAEMSRFDVLYVGLQGTVELSDYALGRHYREKLRKFVDAGGVLWIENCSDVSLGFRDFVTPDLIFRVGNGMEWAVAANPMHPLVHRPYDLSWDELSRLGTDSEELRGFDPDSGRAIIHQSGARSVGYVNGGDRYYMTVVEIKPPDPTPAGPPIMIASQYGSGHIVASAESIGYAISAFGSNGNTRFCPTDRYSIAPSEDLKAAVNIVSWGGENTTFHKNARHTGYSYDEVGAPLALKWEFNEPSAFEPTGSTPAILNDMVFYVDAGGLLHAFDLAPAQDLPPQDPNRDGLPDPDDGLPDYAGGYPYDEVWAQACGPAASSPTTAYVPVGGGEAVAAVFVATGDGKILAFEATTGAPLTGSNPLPIPQSASVGPSPYPPDDITGRINIPAPTYFDGVVYAGDGAGRLWAYNLLFVKDSWVWPINVAPGAGLPWTLNSPTVGYFRNPITGSVDQLVYLAARGKPTSVNGCVYSFPIKVFNEVLTAAPGMAGRYRIRKGPMPMPIKPSPLGGPPTYHLYYTKDTGGLGIIDPSAVSIPATGEFQVTGYDNELKGASVVADYELDTSGTGSGNPPIPAPMYRQRIDVKNKLVTSGNPPGFGVISTPAAAPNDALYYATENPYPRTDPRQQQAASLYAVIEDGWGITTKWRWYLGDPGPEAMLGINTVVIGSPAVGNNMVYYAVNGSTGCILAFHADPVFRIDVGGPIDPRRPVEVLQYDSMNPGREPIAVSGAAEGTDTSRRRVAFKIDYDKGRITIENFLDPLSASQDLVVRFFPPTESGPGTRVEQIHLACPPDDYQYDDSWSNLAWWLKVPAVITSSPTLMGSILYFGDSQGRLHAVNVERTAQMVTNPWVPIILNDDIYWGWEPPDDPDHTWLHKPILSTVAGAQGNLAVSTAEGLFVLYNGLTMVADSHRILDMDAAGRVVWSCDATTSYTGTRLDGTSTPVYAATKIPFNRPSVARRIGAGNILVADTGNHRVVLMDRAGTALVEITEFVDPDPANPILTPGSSLKLNTPTDARMRIVPGPVANTMAYRFLITDSGNYRVVEVDAVFDRGTGRYSRILLRWATHTMEQGKRYQYVSAGRFNKRDDPTGQQTEVICVVNNYVPESSRLETTGGAIVTIDDVTGLIANDGVRRFVDRCDGSLGDIRVVNPTFFTREFRAGGTFTDLIGDSNGIYAMQFARVGSPAPISQRAYMSAQHPQPLAVVYAQLLPSGGVLVTNKASSLNPVSLHGAKGEVFELDRTFTKMEWPKAGVEPGRGSYPLEQPSSAERLLQ